MASWSSPSVKTVIQHQATAPKFGNLRIQISAGYNKPQGEKTQSLMEYSSFIFGRCPDEQESSSSETVTAILGNISIATAGLLSIGPHSSILLSCIPVVVPLSLTRTSNAAYSSILSDDAKNFIKGITYVSVGQGTLAMVDFMFGDLLSGFMKAIFAGLGFYVSHMDDGVSILPSFTVVSFVNGSISMLSAFERMSARMTPLFSGMMPLYLNYIHLSQILHPLLCFAGAYLGWQIIKELRRSGAFASPGYVGDNLNNAFQTSQEPARGRLLSTASSINSSSRNFVPFNGRGHSLSMTQPPPS